MDEERIINLEMKMAYLEDFLNQIQEVAVEQAKDIEKLKSENKKMKEKIKDLSDLAEGDIPNRKPPHY
ncbi:MAG: SlyX family protein [Treponema sp.]|nr:SlyX family protein [Spirochaetia bacterium]MDY2839646.1 SlyX family protein [Treponema sp.]MDY5124492.1 SlyX family protein [Treponema sp.]